MPGRRKGQTFTIPIDIKNTNLLSLQSMLKRYNIGSSDISLAPGENEGEYILKINVGKDHDAQQLLSLLTELKTINDGGP